MENTHANIGQYYLSQAHKAWLRMEEIRAKRERNKNFTYGNQWCDLAKDEYGNIETEFSILRNSGKEPLTNNLIRQLVKSVVGRFRNSLGNDTASNLSAPTSRTLLNELDCRAMEEFLISGCCFQKIEKEIKNGKPVATVYNRNPAAMFLNEIKDPCGRDCELIGELHDMTIAEIISRLADGNRSKALKICEAYGLDKDNSERLNPGNMTDHAFYCSSLSDKFRVIEIWTLESRECYECHDRKTGKWFIANPDSSALADNSLERSWTLRKTWRCRWITPDGTIISQYDSPYPNGTHPYAFKLYPLTDGEVHSLVEDVIDQQKYVNRLITLVDNIMGASAKGVLLFPDNMLPEGYTWADIREAWSKPNGIIPYHPRNMPDKPMQISSNSSNIGAYEMLNLQMKLFEQISGVSGALQGQAVSSATGVKLYESQIENSTVALCDIFESFNAFRQSRNALLSAI